MSTERPRFSTTEMSRSEELSICTRNNMRCVLRQGRNCMKTYNDCTSRVLEQNRRQGRLSQETSGI